MWSLNALKELIVSQALKSSSLLLVDVFGESQSLAYTSFGYNTIYGYRHWKSYKEADCLCANFIRDAIDCAQVRIATLSKRYSVCVLCNNSINLYSICSAVCTLSGACVSQYRVG